MAPPPFNTPVCGGGVGLMLPAAVRWVSTPEATEQLWPFDLIISSPYLQQEEAGEGGGRLWTDGTLNKGSFGFAK